MLGPLYNLAVRRATIGYVRMAARQQYRSIKQAYWGGGSLAHNAVITGGHRRLRGYRLPRARARGGTRGGGISACPVRRFERELR